MKVSFLKLWGSAKSAKEKQIGSLWEHDWELSHDTVHAAAEEQVC